jgi:hypothetical protein
MELFASLLYHLQQTLNNALPGGHWIAKEYNTCRLLAAGEDQLAEVLVFRKEQPIPLERQPYNVRIIGPGRQLGNQLHVMPGIAQGTRESDIAALVR